VSVRKPTAETRKNLTTYEAELRLKQESKALELGEPLCPEQYFYNDREGWKL